MMTTDLPVTKILDQWRSGCDAALQELIPLIYDELKVIAASKLRNRPPDTVLSPTVLVNEACIKLLKYKPDQQKGWQSRAEFYALTAKIMRHILVDHAKRKFALKHGGDQLKVSLDDDPVGKPGLNIIHLDLTLKKLEEMNARQAQIWQCRYLCGLSIAEIVKLFDLSETSIRREMKSAGAWVKLNLSRGVS